MGSLAEFRQQHPEYHDLGDVELADALHAKFYADMPKHEFDKSLGIKTNQGLGFMEGVTNVFDKIPASPMDLIPGLDTRPRREANRADLQADFDQMERTQRPGQVGRFVGAALATAPVAAVTKNPWLLGASQNALASEAKTPMGVAVDAGIGALGGKVMDTAVGAISNALRPVVEPAVQRLKDAGVSLTPGMMRGAKGMAKEDKLTSRPIVGDAIADARRNTLETFNVAAVNKAIAPLGIKVPDNIGAGHDAVAFAQDAINDAYNNVVPKLTVAVDPRFLAGVRKIATQAQSLPSEYQAQLQSVLQGIRFGKGGALAGRQLKDAQGELSRLAKTYSTSAVAPDRELGRAIAGLKDELDDMMMRQNPLHAPDLKKANAAFRGMTIVDDAASRADEGVMSTGQLKQSVRRGDGSRRKAASARGDAYMQDFSDDARAIIPAKLGSSGTADRMQAGGWIANARGAGDLAGFKARQAVDMFNGVNRPAWASPAANALRQSRPLLVLGGSAAAQNALRD